MWELELSDQMDFKCLVSWQHKIFFRFWIRRLSLEASSVTSDIALLTYLQKRKNILQHMNKWKWNMWNYSYNYFPFTIIVLALWWCNGRKYSGHLYANYAMAVWDFLLDFKVSKTTNEPKYGNGYSRTRSAHISERESIPCIVKVFNLAKSLQQKHLHVL